MELGRYLGTSTPRTEPQFLVTVPHTYTHARPAASSLVTGDSQHKLGTAAACAVKRVHLDERVARCAARAGAELMEGFEVGNDVTFNKEEGLWTVKSTGVSRASSG